MLCDFGFLYLHFKPNADARVLLFQLGNKSLESVANNSRGIADATINVTLDGYGSNSIDPINASKFLVQD